MQRCFHRAGQKVLWSPRAILLSNIQGRFMETWGLDHETSIRSYSFICLFLFYLFIWLCWVFTAARAFLYCCVWASHCSGFSCCRAQAPGHMGFSSCGSWALEHRLDRDWTWVTCIRRQILYHWATREALGSHSFRKIMEHSCHTQKLDSKKQGEVGLRGHWKVGEGVWTADQCPKLSHGRDAQQRGLSVDFWGVWGHSHKRLKQPDMFGISLKSSVLS